MSNKNNMIAECWVRDTVNCIFRKRIHLNSESKNNREKLLETYSAESLFTDRKDINRVCNAIVTCSMYNRSNPVVVRLTKTELNPDPQYKVHVRIMFHP